MKILCAFGQYNYGDVTRGTSYEFANFLPALQRMGHEVVHFDTWDKSAYTDFAQLNRAFLAKAEAEQPNIIFCVLLHYELWLETFEEVNKRCNAQLINWGTDDSWKYESFTQWVAPAFHAYVTTSLAAFDKAQYDRHENFILSQWAANSANLVEPLPASQCQYPVSFIGSAYGNRPRWVSDLKMKGIDVACFGHGWPHGPIKSEDIPRIFRSSAISLNFGDSGIHLGRHGFYRSRQIKARVFEVPGAGGFLLTEDAPELCTFYKENEEIVKFSGMKELEQKIKFYLSNPALRDEIAARGFNRTLSEHTYERRFALVFELTAELKSKSNGMVARLSPDNKWYESAASLHQMGFAMRLFRRLLVAAFSLFFGRVRGARAARRFVYEISWRIFREKTYTAAGVPGRMFYKES